jgi:ribonuclease Z
MVNGPFDDPVLYLPFSYHKQAMLFDLGNLSGLSPGDLLKTSQVFVSHTHMDHFIGFDQLLRLLLGRNKSIHLFGPKGFLDNIKGKLKAYTWNLVQGYKEALQLIVTEIHSGKMISQNFDCQSGFKPSRRKYASRKNAVIFNQGHLQVSCAVLDHQIECLGFCAQEHFHINIMKSRLSELNLSAGPWINQFKKRLYSGDDPQGNIQVPPVPPGKTPKTFTLETLARRIAKISQGQKIAYITDCAFTQANQEKIIELARSADALYIEAAFLEKDRRVAASKHHLTAEQAGTIARKANVKHMTVFHHSPRYTDQGHLLEEEAYKAFQGLI